MGLSYRGPIKDPINHHEPNVSPRKVEDEPGEYKQEGILNPKKRSFRNVMIAL